MIKDVSYSFESGKLYLIKGVSGCGKTTLLNIIGGIEKNYEGSVEIKQSDETHVCSVGYVFQNSLLISGLSIRENLKIIRNNDNEIELVCKRTGILQHLDKNPDQLSGGERQRVSIARALLNNPRVLIADEPTASLDSHNAQKIAQVLADQKKEDRIVIIASHENCFDAVADEIIYLKYGRIESVNQTNLSPEPKDTARSPVGGKSHTYSSFRYAAKRDPDGLKILRIIPIALVFLTIFLLSTVQKNFGDEYIRFLQNDYPLDLIVFNPLELENFNFNNELTIYDNYTATEGEVNAYYLLKEKDSVLAIEGMVIAGSFPVSEREILVTQEYLLFCFGDDVNCEACIGKTIVFKELELTISGVLADLSKPAIEHNLFADIYYQRRIQQNAIFIPYETISVIGEKQELDFIVGVYDNLCENEDVLQDLENVLINGTPNRFYADIKENSAIINNIVDVFYVGLLVCSVMSCVFLTSIVQTKLFYRRRELGYLQIFGVPQEKVCRMILAEYAMKIVKAVFIALIAYVVLIVLYYLYSDAIVFCDIYMTAGLIALLFISYLGTAYFSIRKALKDSIVSLIS